MNTPEKIKEALKKEAQRLEGKPGLVKLQKFYDEMEGKGLIRKQTYTLPQLDTIGRSIYHRMKTR